MILGRSLAGLTVAGAALLPQPATAQTPAVSSNVTVVNITGETADITVDGMAMPVPDSAAVPAMRIGAGGHDVTVSTSVDRVEHLELTGGCSALWILLPATDADVVFTDEECPPPRVADTGSASVRVVNMAPNATSITLTVGGETTTSPTRPWHASPRVTVPAGRVQLDVQRADRPGVIRSTAATLRGGTGYAAILAGGGEQRVTFLIVEDAGEQPPSTGEPDIPINMGMAESAATSTAVIVAVAAGFAAFVAIAFALRKRMVMLLLLIASLALIASACGPVERAQDAAGPEDAARQAPGASAPAPTTVPSIPDTPTSVAAPPVAVSLNGAEPLDVVPVPAEGLGSPSVLAIGDVGWVSGTSAPGAGGMALLVGHTSFSGRGAFAHLGDLPLGGRVQVALSDGSSVTYLVEDIFEVAKEEFPTDLIYAPTSVPLLVLVTCSGPRSPVTGLHELNLVVIATLLS